MGEHGTVEHPECGEGLDAAGEFALARAFILTGDHAHAAQHLAFGLADDVVHPEGAAIVEMLVALNGPDASSLIPMTEPVWIGNAAAHVLILHELGHDSEAVTLLFDVLATQPEVRRTRWLLSWLETNPALEVSAHDMARAMLQLVTDPKPLTPDDPRVSTMVDLVSVAEVIAGRAGTPAVFFAVASTTARRVSEFDAALSFAKGAFDREPSAMNLCAVGYAHRERGEVRTALDFFVRASNLDPSLVGLRLDAAQTLAALGHFADAAQWAASAVDIDPTDNVAKTLANTYRELGRASRA